MRQFLLTIGIKHQAGIHRRVISRRKIVPRILVGNQNFADIADRVDGSLGGFALKTVFEIVQGTKTFACVRCGNGVGQQVLVNLDRSVLLQIQPDGFQLVEIGLCNALHIVEKLAGLLTAVVIVYTRTRSDLPKVKNMMAALLEIHRFTGLGLGVSIETTTSLVYDFLAKCDTSHL